jgi:fibro-slime domain-containing protein
MSSSNFRPTSCSRSSFVVSSVCYAALVTACHNPRFQSGATSENTVSRDNEAGVCRGAECTDASTATVEVSTSGRSSTGKDVASDASPNMPDAELQTVVDAGTLPDTAEGTLETGTKPTTSRSDAGPTSDVFSAPEDAATDETTSGRGSAPSNSNATGASDTANSDSTQSVPRVDGGVVPSDGWTASLGDSDADDSSLATGSGDAGREASVDASVPELPLVCERTNVLVGVARDFDEEHPDMEPCEDDGVDCSSERGLVGATLSEDGKPVFVNEARDEDSTIQSEETFNEWFRDIDGVNVAIPFDLRLTTRVRALVFDSDNPPAGSPDGFSEAPKGFFPIDEWNDTERPHNYHFTYQATSHIQFEPGDSLTIRGDDDIFVFIDRKLVIDLGGIHLPQEATIRFDDLAEELDLSADTPYEFHLFFAERHVEQSNLRLSTTGRFYSCSSQ